MTDDMTDREFFDDLSPAKVLRQRFALENALSATRSPTGGHLAALENRINGPGHSGSGRDGNEAKRLRLGTLLLLCNGLTRQEVDTARLYYDGLLELEPYERNVRFADTMEGDGEEIVATRVHAPDGTLMDGYVRMRGVRLRYPKYGAVAEEMAAKGQRTADDLPMTPAAVKRRLSDARAKIAESLKWRMLMTTQEDAAL